MAIVNFAWIKARVKARLPDDPNHPDQQKCSYICVTYKSLCKRDQDFSWQKLSVIALLISSECLECFS